MALALVLVECPHKVGLAYEEQEGEFAGWLYQLPCPCNDRSVVVERYELSTPEDIERFLDG